MALGPPLQTRWRSQGRELTNELLGEDQEAEPHTHWSTAALGKMLRVHISTVKKLQSVVTSEAQRQDL